MLGAVKMPRPKRNDLGVKIEADIVRKARTLCDWKDIVMAQYLSDILRDQVNRDFDKFRREINPDTKRH